MCSGLQWLNVFPKFVEHIDCKTHNHAIIEDLKIGTWDSATGNTAFEALLRTRVLDPFLFKEKYSKKLLTDWAIFSGMLPNDGFIKEDFDHSDETKSIIITLDSIAYHVYHMLQTLNSLAANCNHGRTLLSQHKKLYETLKTQKTCAEANGCIENNHIFKIAKGCIPDSLSKEKKGIAFAICFVMFFTVNDDSSVSKEIIQPLTLEEERLKGDGNNQYDKMEYAKAVIFYTNITQTNKYNSVPYSNRAQSFIKLGKFTKSELDGYRVIVLTPGWCKGYCRLAISLEGQKKLHAAHLVATWGLSKCEASSQCNDFTTLSDICTRLKDTLGLERGICSYIANAEEEKEKPLEAKRDKQPNYWMIPDLVSDSEKESDDECTVNTDLTKNQNEKKQIKQQETQEQKFSVPNLLDLIKEQKNLLKAGSMLIIANKYLEAVPHYEKAYEMIPLFQQQNYDIEQSQLLVLKYALGIAHVGGTFENLKKALNLFQEINETYSKTFLAIHYGLSTTFVKLYRFDDAVKQIEAGLAIASNVNVFSTYNWPGTDNVIEHTIPDRLKVALTELSGMCKVTPDAFCRFDFCLYGKKMYFSNPEYKGCYQVNCIGHCKLEFHPQCWKSLSDKMDLSEKEFLNRECLTPDCGNLIVNVLKMDRYGNIEKNFMSDVGQKSKSSKHRKSKLERKFEQKEIRKSNKKREKVTRVSESETAEVSETVVLEDNVEENEDENVKPVTSVNQNSEAICDKTVETAVPKPEVVLNYEVNSTPLYVIKKDDVEKEGVNPTVEEKKQNKKGKKKKKTNVMSAEEFCGEAFTESGNIHAQRLNRLQEQKEMAEQGLVIDSRYKPLPNLASMGQLNREEYPFYIPNNLREDMFEMENVLQNFPALTESEEDRKIVENIFSLFEDMIRNEPILTSSEFLFELAESFPFHAKTLIQEYGGIVNFLLQDSSKFVLIDDHICLANKVCGSASAKPNRMKVDTLDLFDSDLEEDSSNSESDSDSSDEENWNEEESTQTGILPNSENDSNVNIKNSLPTTKDLSAGDSSKITDNVRYSVNDSFNIETGDIEEKKNDIEEQNDKTFSTGTEKNFNETSVMPFVAVDKLEAIGYNIANNDIVKWSTETNESDIEKENEVVDTPIDDQSNDKPFFETPKSIQNTFEVVRKSSSGLKSCSSPSLFQLQVAVIALPQEKQVTIISSILNSIRNTPGFWELLNKSLNNIKIVDSQDKNSPVETRDEQKDVEHMLELEKRNETIRSLQDQLTSSFDAIAKLRKTTMVELTDYGSTD